MWKTPTIKEISVGLEINCYACAEIQYCGGAIPPPHYGDKMDLQTPKVFSLEIERIAKEKVLQDSINRNALDENKEFSFNDLYGSVDLHESLDLHLEG